MGKNEENKGKNEGKKGKNEEITLGKKSLKMKKNR